MFEKYNDDGRKFRMPRVRPQEKPKRVFTAAADEGPVAPPEATRELLLSYFNESNEEERKPAQVSLLVSILSLLISLYLVFPTMMEFVDISKRPEEIYIPAGGYKSLPLAATKKQEQPKTIKQEFIPQLYPEIRDINLVVDDDTVEITESDWNGLSIDGSVDGVEFGLGGSGSGPTINAGAGGDVPEPELLYRVEPDYPEAARRARVDGFVLIQAIVSKTGDVIDIKVLQSPPAKYGFAEKAVEAVGKWKFKPSIYRGKPVNVRIRFAVEFNLLY